MTGFQLFKELINLNNKFFNANICPNCFKKYDIEFKVCLVKGCISIRVKKVKEIVKKIKYTKKLILKSSPLFFEKIYQAITHDYQITYDNFLKMLLINLRV